MLSRSKSPYYIIHLAIGWLFFLQGREQYLFKATDYNSRSIAGQVLTDSYELMED